MLTVDEASTKLRGVRDGLLARDKVLSAKADGLIFVFSWQGKLKIPAFQFDDNSETGVCSIVPTLVGMLSTLSDHSQFRWLTTQIRSKRLAPADLLHREDLREELVKRAELFRQDHQLQETRVW